MKYVLLFVTIALECAGTYCIKLSDGFRLLVPAISGLLLYALCLYLFSKVLQQIPLSVAYATWGALGVVLATFLSVFAFDEPINGMVVFGIVLAIAGVVIVNMFSA